MFTEDPKLFSRKDSFGQFHLVLRNPLQKAIFISMQFAQSFECVFRHGLKQRSGRNDLDVRYRGGWRSRWKSEKVLKKMWLSSSSWPDDEGFVLPENLGHAFQSLMCKVGSTNRY